MKTLIILERPRTNYYAYLSNLYPLLAFGHSWEGDSRSEAACCASARWSPLTQLSAQPRSGTVIFRSFFQINWEKEAQILNKQSRSIFTSTVSIMLVCYGITFFTLGSYEKGVNQLHSLYLLRVISGFH